LLPFLTAYDPLSSSNGSIDPLGSLQGYMTLADMLLPGVTTITNRSRYPWSSHAANAEGKEVKWLVPHGEYLALGLTEETRRAAYRGLFASELEPILLRGIRGAAHAGYAIGSQRFRAEIETALQERVVRQHIPRYAVMMR